MKVKLLRTTRIAHEAGEIVEVYPAVASFLIGVGSAVKAEEEQPKPKPKKKK